MALKPDVIFDYNYRFRYDDFSDSIYLRNDKIINAVEYSHFDNGTYIYTSGVIIFERTVGYWQGVQQQRESPDNW